MREDRPSPSRRRPGLPLVALAASLAVHVALLALLAREGDGPPPRTAAVPFTIELRPSPPAAAPPAAPPASARAAAPPAAPSRRERPSRRSRTVAARPAEPDAAPRGEVASGGTLPVGPGATPRQLADLHVRPPGPPPAWTNDSTDGQGARDALGDWAREQAGRARAASGAVHPYYRDVGRALLGAWDAEKAVARRGLSGYLAQAGENLRTFARVWQRAAAGYGSTGAPGIVDGGSERMKDLSSLPPGPARDALVGAEVHRQLRPALSEGRVTRVRVTQAADGRLLSIEVVSPSSDPEIDRAAVAGARAAIRELPPPPAEALAGRTVLVSLWELELEISIAPPLPMVAIELDEVLGLTDVRLPLDRRIWKRVRLVAAN